MLAESQQAGAGNDGGEGQTHNLAAEPAEAMVKELVLGR